MHRVSQGDGPAQELLAMRLVGRAQRVAHALMSRSPLLGRDCARPDQDADDAAQHALIEVLRSAHLYRGEPALETWADRIIGRSVVRFARAVRRRNPALSSALDDSRAPEGGPTARLGDAAPLSLDEYLRIMPAVRREVLFLRHALGHGVEQIAEITQASASMVRERLLAARRELRQRPSRDRPMDHASDSLTTTDAERWALLSDRDAVGDMLTDRELVDLAELERTDPVARSFATEMRELSGYLDTASGDTLSVADRETVQRVLSAVRATSQPLGIRDPDADLASAVDPEGPRWIRSASIALTVLLAVSAGVALVLFEPRSVQPSGRLLDSSQPALAPTVEALTTAHTHQRGGRLRRAGRALGPGEVLSAGEVLGTADKAGCFVIEPAIAVCLAASSSVRIGSLALRESRVEVLSGRVVATHEAHGGSFELRASLAGQGGSPTGEVRARAIGTVFGLERSDDGQQVRVRVLDGRVQVRTPFGASEPHGLQVAVVRSATQSNVVEDLPEPQAQREWELRAVGALEIRR
jgi:RNA polymerase sigma factor (sigma-70 family)